MRVTNVVTPWVVLLCRDPVPVLAGPGGAFNYTELVLVDAADAVNRAGEDVAPQWAMHGHAPRRGRRDKFKYKVTFEFEQLPCCTWPH